MISGMGPDIHELSQLEHFTPSLPVVLGIVTIIYVIAAKSYAWLSHGANGFLSQVACICTYRLHFHPLRHFPGPLLARLTDAYVASYSFRGDMHQDIRRCHQRYGTSRFARVQTPSY